jgi:hypothetical protein
MIASLLAFAAVLSPEWFETRVRPVLAARCQQCHNSKQRMGDLDLTSEDGFHRGPGVERFLRAISYEAKLKMPPAGRLSDSELAALTEWVRGGAPWPAAAVAPSQSDGRWWSFRPLRTALDHDSIDAFLQHRLRAKGIRRAPLAHKQTLIRRATFDLTGLPPTPAEIQDFLEDAAPGAFSRVVDRLLASPRYGERWGRHWLDVARYADSTGVDEDHRYPYAWRYRDYVIDAFNRDLPYDQFVREQIAGDLLKPESAQVNVRGIIATGFLALGPKLIAEQDKVKMFYDVVDEQIDTTGKAFLGLTLACARCHDHKFDPISTRDYYSLASIFASTKQFAQLEGTVSKLYFAPLVSREIANQYEEHLKKVQDKQNEIDAVANRERSRHCEQHSLQMADYMLAAHEVYEGGKPAEEAASARGLDARIVRQWVDYLKPTGERRPQLEAFYQAPDTTRESVARRFQTEFEAEARLRRESKDRKFLAGDHRFYADVVAASGPFALPKENPDQLYTAESRDQLARLNTELEALKKGSPAEPPLACGVAEDKSVEQHVFRRGDPAQRGDPVPKRFPAAVAGEQQTPIREGSGRLELAHWIASGNNPLTARVMVNRIWQWHFGEGLVRTPSNFGRLGEAPAHPELLDWLSREFIASGWSLKAMHRRIMLSEAYQMSSQPTAEALDRDPDNRLWSRFLRRRLSVEEMRDAMMAVDGTLSLEIGGSYQKGQGTDKEFAEDRKTIDPDTIPRRLVYLPLRRSNLPSLLNLFDFGDATTSSDGRAQTNIAPQALFMMNSPFVESRAGNLARQLEPQPHGVRQAWWRVVGRAPSAGEIQAALEYVAGFPGGDRQLAWKSYCRTLLASNDFLYVQ